MRLETADCDDLYFFIMICNSIKSSPGYSHSLKQRKESKNLFIHEMTHKNHWDAAKDIRKKAALKIKR